MLQTETSRLAIEGGRPVRSSPLPPVVYGVAEIGQAEIDAVTDVLRRRELFRWATSGQSYASRFEAAYAEFTGSRHALAVTGGTAALVAGLVGLGVGVGDEVIVPAYTYISTAAAVLSVGAIPVIAEIDDTLTLDPADVDRKITPLTRCILPVHMRGLPAQMSELLALARDHDLRVLEDVAQANGGEYRGRRLGALGDAGVFSFQQFKLITSGEGGMLVTDDELVYERAACKHDSAISFWRPDTKAAPSFAGENARMDELRAALGLTQLGRLGGILERTRALKRRMLGALADAPGIRMQRVVDPAGDCGISMSFYLADAEQAQRFSAALEAEGARNATLHNRGVLDRHIYVNWDYVLGKLSADRTGFPWAARYYEGTVEYDPDMCPRTLDHLARVVTIDISQAWSDDDADDVVTAVRKVARWLHGAA